MRLRIETLLGLEPHPLLFSTGDFILANKGVTGQAHGSIGTWWATAFSDVIGPCEDVLVSTLAMLSDDSKLSIPIVLAE
jgi:hypothetical protein